MTIEELPTPPDDKEAELTALREQLAAARLEIEDLRAASLRRQGVSKAPVQMADAKAFAADYLDGLTQPSDVPIHADLERRFKAAIAAGKRQGQLGRYGYLLALDEAAPRGHLDEALGDDPWAFAAAFRELVDGADGVEFPVLVGWFRRALEAGDKHSARAQVMGDHARRLWRLLEEVEQIDKLDDIADATFRSTALSIAEDRGAWRDLEDGRPFTPPLPDFKVAAAAAVKVELEEAFTAGRAAELVNLACRDLVQRAKAALDDATPVNFLDWVMATGQDAAGAADLVADVGALLGAVSRKVAELQEQLDSTKKPAAKPKAKPAKRAPRSKPPAARPQWPRGRKD